MSATANFTHADIRALLADDDPLFTRLAASCLATGGIRTDIRQDGADALEALQADAYDVALIDLSMPRIDGFRLIAWIRSSRHLKHLPVIVLSGRSDVEAIQEAFRIGANAFHTKPINWGLLPTHLRHVVGEARAAAELRAEVQALRSAVRQMREMAV